MGNEDLLPCPFCGGVKTELRPVQQWMGQRYQELAMEVLHFCDKREDNFITGSFKLRARDKEQAIAVWNSRWCNGN
jgi:hypothetical protein